MNTLYHCKGSVHKWGGKPQDYQAIHDFVDSSKSTVPDVRHRALLHSAFGCFMVERVFGVSIVNTDGREVPVREIVERHIIEDLGFIPTVEDFLSCIPLSEAKWMGGHVGKLLRSGEHVPAHIRAKYVALKGE